MNDQFRAVLEQRHGFYELKDGDKLSIRLYDRPGDWNQEEVLILPDGRSDLFHMDNRRLVGKTLAEVEAELRASLVALGQVKDSDMSIQVTPRDEYVYLVGQFEGPGRIPMTVKLTLSEAIAIAGGTRVTGDTDWALLRRPYLDPRAPVQLRVDLNDTAEDIFLLPGDQVILQRTFLAGVVNYLREYIFQLLPGGGSSYGAALAAL